ncbi:MAG: hypothetical protein HYR72_04810 [Deltaproteobacteria bacterium]|nr:hypothetical protein [Deltaproteobacteria bacterium]MBI3389793.1 hypothetical protein [Deltaproteobacteria bacterium]
MTKIRRLQKVIRDLHGLDSEHVESVPVNETINGEPVWQGIVEVFAVTGHAKAKTVYAWSYEADSGERRHVAVLGVPPVNSAVDAVRIVVVNEIRKQSGRS